MEAMEDVITKIITDTDKQGKANGNLGGLIVFLFWGVFLDNYCISKIKKKNDLQTELKHL